jgi:hypothetical protein
LTGWFAKIPDIYNTPKTIPRTFRTCSNGPVMNLILIIIQAGSPTLKCTKKLDEEWVNFGSYPKKRMKKITDFACLPQW